MISVHPATGELHFTATEGVDVFQSEKEALLHLNTHNGPLIKTLMYVIFWCQIQSFPPL